MRYLNKIVFLNSAHVPYAEIKLDGNVHFIGTQGVGKSTLLRAILFFYNADKLRLGIPKEKKNFDTFYLPYSNSYIVYEVMRENGAYSVLVTKSMGRAAFRFIDAPYEKNWLVTDTNEVLADWPEIRKRIPRDVSVSALKTEYYEFRDIIFGNNRNPGMTAFRKYAIVESTRYQNIPLTIQNVFLNSKLDADFIKNTIIQSMNEDELSIDLSYYRSQIETFEQEYKDVMLWVQPNKNGVVEVRKQADAVIHDYRSLLYQKQTVVEGRCELNYAERTTREMLPMLEIQIREGQGQVDRFRRLLNEENEKYNREREKLVGIGATLADKIKTIGQKRKYYEEQHIEDVVRRVGEEESLNHELESLRKAYAELTKTYDNILQKYKLLSEQLEYAYHVFEHGKQKEILDQREACSLRKSALLEEEQHKLQQIRTRFEEKLQTLNDDYLRLVEDIAACRQHKTKVSLTTHFQTEISVCTSELNQLSQEESQVQLSIERLKVDIERQRQLFSGEIQKLEWESQKKADVIRSQRKVLDEEIAHLQNLLERWKGSFCEWLEQHQPGWQQTLGKVVDEQTVLFNQQLSPSLSAKPSADLFGVKIDLTKIDRELRTPEMLKADLTEKQQIREAFTRQLNEISQEKEMLVAQIQKKANQQIRALSEQQHLQEAQFQQIPSRKKKWQADLETWQRKESEWKREQISAIDLEIGEKAKCQEEIQQQQQQIRQERERQMKRVTDDRRKAENKEEKLRDEAIQSLKESVMQQHKELENKLAELRHSQTAELDGKGADTAIINSYQQKITHVEKELRYISGKRSLVIEYEKDKREYFDLESNFRFEKKENEAALSHLDGKYRQRRERDVKNLDEADQRLQEKIAEQKSLQQDLQQLSDFKTDTYLCPPESFTAEERPTKKSCGKIIDELKSMIISIQKDTEHFKRAVNAFKSYFTARNTFSFPTALATDTDFYDFASNLCEFVEDNKIEEYQTRISERYTNIIRRISKEVGDMTQNESEIHKTIKAINSDFVQRNFAGVIRSIELRPLPSNDKLMQLLLEIKSFNEANEFNMGALDLFSAETRGDVNEKAVRYLYSFSQKLQDEPARKSLVLADTFNLQFRIVENDNDTGWIEKIANVGSDGTDILVKAMVNIMLINVFKEKASRKFGDFKLHCMMDEIGKLHPNNVKGILAFANCRNILLINSSPTTYNVEDYRYTYLLSKDAKSNTRVVPLLTHL